MKSQADIAKWRRLEIVVLSSLVGSVVAALPLRMFARTLAVPVFVVAVAAGACLGVAIGSGALRRLVTNLRNRPRARRWTLVVATILLGAICVVFRLSSSPWPLLMAARYGDHEIRCWAERELWQRGPDLIPGLLVRLESKDAISRRQAAKILGELEPRSINALLRMIGHEDPHVREMGAMALGRITSAPSLDAQARRVALALVPLLVDVHRNVREPAARALTNLKPPQKDIVPALVEIVRTGDLRARQSAIGVLATMGSAAENATPALIEALPDEDPRVMVSALNALRFIGPAARDAVPAILDALDNPAVWFRNTAVDAARHIDLAESVARLVSDLEHLDPSRRKRSAWALGKFGSDARDAIPALMRTLDDIDDEVRQAAADAIEHIERGNR